MTTILLCFFAQRGPPFHDFYFVFSEGEYETSYYSYPSHLEELIKCLKDDGFEKPLVQTLEEKFDIITQHMKCTEELTNAAKGIKPC